MQAVKPNAERFPEDTVALPASEGCPPFLILVDVGRNFERYAEFTRHPKV